MTQEPSKAARVPANELLFLFKPDFRDRVVEHACEGLKKATPDTKKAFKTALRNHVRIRGFRDPSIAPPAKLASEVCYEVERNAKLTSAVFQVWSESRRELRELAVARLSANDIPVGNHLRNFAEDWTKDEWLRHRDALCAEHPELDKDEAGLMLCLASGICPAPDEDEVEFEFASPRFQRWLEDLRKLPVDAPEWYEALKFGDAVTTIAEESVAEHIRGHFAMLQHDIDGLREKYEAELGYLDINASSWQEQASKRISSLGDAQGVILALKDELKSYQPVYPKAPTREEEKHRSVMREKCERAILKRVEEWKEIMSRPVDPPPVVADERPPYRVDEEDKSDGEAEVAEEEREMWKSKHDALAERNESLGKELEQATEAKAGMQLEKAQLCDQIAELKSQLAQSQQTERNWRQAYVNALGRANAQDADAPSDFANAEAAIAHAERVFDNQLVIALNGKSERNQSFLKPDELFHALAWLATDYHRLRPNPGPSPDFDRMIREACPGWTYKPNQTETTMGMYPVWYQTTWQGRKYELSHHIGKGNGRNPQNNIRIAFDWDGEHQRVVVGYIGRHQRNRSS